MGILGKDTFRENECLLENISMVGTINSSGKALIYPDIIREIRSITYYIANANVSGSIDGDYLHCINNLDNVEKIRFTDSHTFRFRLPDLNIMTHALTRRNFCIKIRLAINLDFKCYIILRERYNSIHIDKNSYNMPIEQTKIYDSVVSNKDMTIKCITVANPTKNILIDVVSKDDNVHGDILENVEIYVNGHIFCTIDKNISRAIYKNTVGGELGKKFLYYDFGFGGHETNHGTIKFSDIKLIVRHKKFSGKIKYYLKNLNIMIQMDGMAETQFML